ncbi:MAG: ABC transporter substrate-binding protein [Myxococcota bacterium]
MIRFRYSMIALLSSFPALASATESPMGLLRRSHARVNQLLLKERGAGAQDPTTREEIKNVVNGFLDYRELAKRGLDQHWQARTRREQEEFVAVLRELIERNYVKQLRDNFDYEIIYRTEEIGGTEATVHTVVRVMKRGRPADTEIDYKFRREGDRWFVFDIITDGMSLVKTYKSQFNRIIQRESYEALVKKMKRKLEED